MTKVYLVCTVGGSVAPIVSSLLRWKPEKLCLLASNETRGFAKDALAQFEIESGVTRLAGADEIRIVEDAQALASVVRSARGLTSACVVWNSRGDDHQTVVDFTGGTKAMSAGIALVARQWKCGFSYVGGTQRTKDGTGIVVSGSESINECSNPWDDLGLQTADDAVADFNRGAYAAAANRLEDALQNLTGGDASLQRVLRTLKIVMDAYVAWDRFEHGKAAKNFEDALKNRYDFSAVFGTEAVDPLVVLLKRGAASCRAVAEASGPTFALVQDLIENAERRAAEGRYDDAVARLYRACEGIAQAQLHDKHMIETTKAVPLEMLPQPLRDEWGPRARNETVRIGLQDAFRLLSARDDALGNRFTTSNLADRVKSPLVARNDSILAHGFKPVRKRSFEQLRDEVVKLLPNEALPASSWTLPQVQ